MQPVKNVSLEPWIMLEILGTDIDLVKDLHRMNKRYNVEEYNAHLLILIACVLQCTLLSSLYIQLDALIS